MASLKSVSTFQDAVDVELLFWAGCPSHPKALADLRTQMTLLGLDANQVEVREIASESEADAEAFVGSPTIRVNGADVVDPANQPAALTCRVYHRRDGRVSPTPDIMSLLGSAGDGRPAGAGEKKKTRAAIGRNAAQEGTAR